MTKPSEKLVEFPQASARDVLTDVLRTGAQRMLATAIEAEVDEYLDARATTVDAAGQRGVVRNGRLPERTIQTPVGDVQVQQPRVRDRRPADERETFRSAILPPYLRKTPSLEALYPWLYLKGISTGGFGEALQALLGPEARGLSATTITRLKAVWAHEYQDWSKRSLAYTRYAYVWADGVYFNVRLEDTDNKRQCILVLMGATRDGTKELIAITDGYRESEQSWRELLLDVRARGLTIDPELAIGDGGLGFHASAWAVLQSVAPKLGCTAETRRTWVRQAQRDAGHRPGLTTSERERLKELEREVRELKRANEILRKAFAYVAPGTCASGGHHDLQHASRGGVAHGRLEMSGHPGSRRPRESGSHPDDPARHCARGHRRGCNTLRARAQIVARRVRSRLPPPPPSRPDARTPGLLRAHRRFSRCISGAFGGHGKSAGETRGGRRRGRVPCPADRLASRVLWSGVGALGTPAHARRTSDRGTGGTAQCCRPICVSRWPHQGSHPGKSR